MPIQVTCPGCFSRFSVSDKYAGKKGPCPKCKKEITIPELKDQVVIHAPETEGPKDASGRPVLRPIRRIETKLSLPVIIGSVVGAIVAIGAAFAIRASGQTPSTSLLAIGAVLLAAPLAYAGYHFLRSDELGGYTGIELLTRTAICAAVFAATWAVYYMLGLYFRHKTMADIPVAEMAIFMAIMVGIGAFASFATLELETGQAVLHYLLFFIVTFLLANTAGVTLGEPLASPDQKKQRQVIAPTTAPQPGTIPARGTTPAAPTGTGPTGTTPAGTTPTPKPNAPSSKS